jgi:hypothetical protein
LDAGFQNIQERGDGALTLYVGEFFAGARSGSSSSVSFGVSSLVAAAAACESRSVELMDARARIGVVFKSCDGGFREQRIEPQLFHAMPSQRFLEVEQCSGCLDRRDVIGEQKTGTGCISNECDRAGAAEFAADGAVGPLGERSSTGVGFPVEKEASLCASELE